MTILIIFKSSMSDGTSPSYYHFSIEFLRKRMAFLPPILPSTDTFSQGDKNGFLKSYTKYNTPLFFTLLISLASQNNRQTDQWDLHALLTTINTFQLNHCIVVTITFLLILHICSHFRILFFLLLLIMLYHRILTLFPFHFTQDFAWMFLFTDQPLW